MLLSPLSSAGPVRLLAPREEVLRALGQPQVSYKKAPSAVHPTDSWYSGALQVFYCGATPQVEYVELSHGTELAAILFGTEVFAIPAYEVVSLLGAKTEVREEEKGCSYICPRMELALWRASAENVTFATVGIGGRGYFSGAVA
jgi:hypothetical protein